MMRKAYKDRMLPEAFKKQMEKKKAQKKGQKREDPKGNPGGYYDSNKKKKADMGRKGPYADGMGKKCTCDAVAEEFNAVLDTEAREDKPCGNSYIPEAAKCSKGRGTAKASKESLKNRALAKEREVNKGRSTAKASIESLKERALAKEQEVNKKRGKKKMSTGRRALGAYLGTMSAISGITQAGMAGQALAKGQYGKAFGSAALAAGNLSGANAYASGNIGRGLKRQMIGNVAGLGTFVGGEGVTGYKRARAKGARPLKDLLNTASRRAQGVRRYRG